MAVAEAEAEAEALAAPVAAVASPRASIWRTPGAAISRLAELASQAFAQRDLARPAVAASCPMSSMLDISHGLWRGEERGTYAGRGAGLLADGEGSAGEFPAGALGELGVELGRGQRGARGDGEDDEDLGELHFGAG